MTKTEAAEVIALRTIVTARQRGVQVIDRTFVACIISECEHQTPVGSRAHQAAMARPAFQTVRAAGRRMA